MKKLCSLLLAAVLILGMSVPMTVFADKETDETNKEQTISIIFSHDMHSHLDASTYVKNGETYERGGFAKLATTVNQIKEEYPDTFMFDAGDFSMGTPFMTIYERVAAELRMMGVLGYDAVTLGNHEFDYRPEGLNRMMKATMKSGDPYPQIVEASIDWTSSLAVKDEDYHHHAIKLQETCNNYGMKDYTVIEKNGTRIAVFGIFGKESEEYAPLAGVKFYDPIEAARRTVEAIKSNEEDIDLVVCLSHSGTNTEDPEKSEDEILARSVSGIDLIVSGHSHSELSQPLVVNNTVIASCGEYTNNLGHLTFTKTDEGYALGDYALIPMKTSVVKDWRIQNLVEQFRAQVDERYFSQYGYTLDTVLARAPFDFTDFDQFGAEQGEDTLGNLITDSYIYAVKKAEGEDYEPVDVAITAKGVIRDSIKKGNVTVEDVFNVLSLGIGPDVKPGYPLVSVYLTGAELKTMAEVDISVSEIMEPARLYMSGLKYTYNPNRLILNRVTSTQLDLGDGKTQELDNDKLYRVVGGLFACQMIGTVESKSYGLLVVEPKDKDGNVITNFEEHIIYDSRTDMELKEWYALATYVDSFKNNTIPDRFQSPEGRKVEVDSKNIIELVKSPNKIFWMALGVLIIILAILILAIILISRLFGGRRRRHRNKKNEPAPIFSNRKNKYRSRWKR
ncbi:MAG TPA: bifunctional UDP-sugar hydrolase/5'-nucleotidase [Anaerovoracaceae bacterium]|nr:bifunctional UDP-sugar hydrolase/5'-nucleotidase [Anaerovoracaceae bacterium]